jgi:hypothetical protein
LLYRLIRTPSRRLILWGQNRGGEHSHHVVRAMLQHELVPSSWSCRGWQVALLLPLASTTRLKKLHPQKPPPLKVAMNHDFIEGRGALSLCLAPTQGASVHRWRTLNRLGSNRPGYIKTHLPTLYSII